VVICICLTESQAPNSGTDMHTQNSGRAQKRAAANSDIGSVAAPALKKGICGNC